MTPSCLGGAYSINTMWVACYLLYLLEGTSIYFCPKDYPCNHETCQGHISVAVLDDVF